MHAACAPSAVADRRPTRSRSLQSARSAPPRPDRPARFNRNELVDLLREYRIHPSLSDAQRREAVAWITGHQSVGA